MKNKIQNFLFNWNRVNEKSLKIYNSLEEAGINCTVINSADKEKEGWVNLGDDYWLYGQTCVAFSRFDSEHYDYMNIMFGDIEYYDYTKLIERTHNILDNNKNIGIYAPEYSGKAMWTMKNTILTDDVFKDPSLKPAILCDYWYLTIHKEIVLEFKTFLSFFLNKYPTFSLWKGAWGIGTIICLIAHLQNKFICRDSQINLFHDNVTGYSMGAETSQQFEILVSEFKEFTKKHKKIDFLRSKVHTRSSRQTPVSIKEIWS